MIAPFFLCVAACVADQMLEKGIRSDSFRQGRRGWWGKHVRRMGYATLLMPQSLWPIAIK